MAVNSLVLPYTNFKLGDTIDPDEFNANNSAIISKVNELVNVANTGSPGGSDGDNIFLPSYIKETYIDPVEIKSPMISGNTLIGATGMVGITSLGSANDSVRIWAGHIDKNLAPFKVSHEGEVFMSKANIKTKSDENNAYVEIKGSSVFGGITDSKSYSLSSGIYNVGANKGIRSGLLRLYTFLPGETSPSREMDITNCSISTRGCNLVLTGANMGMNRCVVIAHSLTDSPQTITQPYGTILYAEGSIVSTKNITSEGNLIVKGNINLSGDIYVNGVKMKLTPA